MRSRGALAAGTVALALLISGCTSSTNNGANLVAASCTGGTIAGLDEAQSTVARTIAQVALSVGAGEKGVLIGEAAGLAESGLRNLNYGDMMGPIQSDGTRGMSSSLGVFQQLKGWGSIAERTDVTKAATMFYTGGQIVAGIPNDGKEPGLLQINGWQNMPPAAAAQAVQGSEFTDGSNYQRQMAQAQAITTAVMAGCIAPGAGGANLANGVSVTIPNNQFVDQAVRGKTITAPSEAMARGIAAGFDQLGLPYVWGGGGSGAGPNDGCSRGGGALNSCQGIIGLDCSGLTAFVLGQAGVQIPGDSGSQRAGGVGVPKDQAVAGDIYGFPGHVAVALGFIDGTPYILEASDVGIPIHVVPMRRGDVDSQVHRYWGASPTA